MKKLFACLLCAALMLGACAFTQGPEGGRCYSLGDIVLHIGDEEVDMSGVKLGVDVFGGDEPNAVLLHLDVDGETLCQIGVTKAEGLYVLHLQSQAVGHKDYAIDPVIEMTRALNDVRDGLIEMLQNTDTEAVAESIVGLMESLFKQPAAAEEPVEEPEEETEEPVAEEPAEGVTEIEIHLSDLAKIGLDGDPMEVIMNCVQGPETVTMGGVHENADGSETEIPEGEYEKLTVTFDAEDLLELLGMITIDGQALPVDQLPEEFKDAFQFTVATYAGLDGVDCDFGYVNAGMNSEEGVVFGMGYMSTATADGNATQAAVGMGSYDELVTASFTVSDSPVQGEAFGPDAIDMDSLINLSVAEDEEAALDALLDDLGMVAVELVSGLTAPIMGAMEVPEG